MWTNSIGTEFSRARTVAPLRTASRRRVTNFQMLQWKRAPQGWYEIIPPESTIYENRRASTSRTGKYMDVRESGWRFFDGSEPDVRRRDLHGARQGALREGSVCGRQ